LEATLVGNLGKLALDREEWNEARELCNQARFLAYEIRRQELIASNQYHLSQIHEAEGHEDLALPIAEEALKIFERLQHRNLAEVREMVAWLKGKIPPP
jgi:hypothetical protein